MDEMIKRLSRVQAHDPLEGGQLQEVYAMRQQRDFNVHFDNVEFVSTFSVETLKKYFGSYYGILMQERGLVAISKNIQVRELTSDGKVEKQHRGLFK